MQASPARSELAHRLVRQRARGPRIGEDDVDVAMFMRACREYTVVLKRIGSTTKMAVREVGSNMDKIEPM